MKKWLGWGLIGLLVLSPHYRGGYPEYYKLLFTAGIFLLLLLFVLARIRKGERTVDFGVEGLCVLLLVGASLLAVPRAANRGDALSSVLVFAGWWSVLILAFSLMDDQPEKRFHQFSLLLLANATLMTVLSFLSGFEAIPESLQNVLDMSWWGLFHGRRVSTGFQYANTAASYLSAFLLVGTYLRVRAEKAGESMALSLMSAVVLAGVFFSYSRGSNLFFFAALGVLFVVTFLWSPRHRLKTAWIWLGLVSPLLAFLIPMELALRQGDGVLFWLFLALYGGSVLLIHRMFPRVETLIKGVPSREPVACISWAALTGVILGLVFFHPMFAPPVLLERMGDITFETPSVSLRLFFYLDALKMALARPLLGWGGLGWQARYLSFQSFSYASLFPHSLYLNTLVETGIVGLFFLLWGLLMVLRKTLQTLFTPRGDENSKFLIGFLLCVVFMLFVHSSIDLNFVMAGFAWAAWFFLGALSGLIWRPETRTIRIPASILLATSLVLLGTSLLIANSHYYTRTADHYQEEGLVREAIDQWDQALRLYPWNSRAEYKLIFWYRDAYHHTGEDIFLEAGEEAIARALLRQPGNREYYWRRGEIALIRGETEKGLADLRRSQTLAPHLVNNYEILFLILYEHLVRSAETGDQATITLMIAEAESLWEQFHHIQQNTVRPVEASEVMIELRERIKDRES